MLKGKDKAIGDRDDGDESVGVGVRKKYPIHIVIMTFWMGFDCKLGSVTL